MFRFTFDKAGEVNRCRLPLPRFASVLSDYRRYPNQQANECDYQHDEGDSFGDLSEARYTGREIGHLCSRQFVIFVHGLSY